MLGWQNLAGMMAADMNVLQQEQIHIKTARPCRIQARLASCCSDNGEEK
ncbi:hypothetical protein [Bradyrhizobium sacchari]|uniref:Uncharacterized protein n=1 Tax=Bradyrhizobium sacchari TaxID=1399419 RepID=A0A560JES6_9BRAD|nr:hypothetical protein [Bradyrhizobium sacchari]TWB51292.1 hypothetical protein FBZ94_110122 [Bradyrhizobium sacchari]TWB69526.1 hypothetical protein FBZ95_109122 [Bradyrhizobium sacchari]